MTKIKICGLRREQDIRYANERGITVTGIRDYGDEGVVGYVVCHL